MSDIEPVAVPGVRLGREVEHDELVGRALSFRGPAIYERDDLAEVPEADLSQPGVRAVTAAGPRRARAAATVTTGDPGTAHNWVPIGPRNIAGRIRALACADPAAATTWYAGSAGGGVWKTTNGGRRWTPLWHSDQACLEIGALAVAPGNARRIYAATGEAVPASQIAVRSHGVFVSTDEGVTWDNHGAGAANPSAPRGFEAIAVDPADERHCWAVGPDGAFRTTTGGTAWTHLDPDVYYTDVAFGAGGRLFLTRGTSRAGEGAVIRLAGPSTATTADLQAAGNASVAVPAVPSHRPWPRNAVLAVAPNAQATVYCRWADEAGNPLGIFRATNANAANATTISWRPLPLEPTMHDEEQGYYDLCLAVDPTDASNVVTGQQQLYRSTNADTANLADVRWQRIMSWELSDEGLEPHQTDHHHLVFAGPGPELWVAGDGGIARSADWRTGASPMHGQRFRPDPARPAPPRAVRWVKRDHGITGAQAYDIGQHPLVPGVVAAGLQDHGTVLRPGGLTWSRVFGADGAHAVFDPDDPYRLHISYYAGLVALQFPALLDRLFADGARDTEQISFRFLADVTDPAAPADPFAVLDKSPFFPETERHPRRTGRMLVAREGRLWGLRAGSGERLVPEPLGRSFEFVARRPAAGNTLLTIADTPGAWRLGLVPGSTVRPDRSAIGVTSRAPAPFVLAEGDVLTLTVNGTAFTTTFNAAAGIVPGRTTAADVVRLVTAAIPAGLVDRFKVKPYVWDTPSAVLLVARDEGPTSPRQFQLDGAALAPQADGLSRLGLNAGTYVGDAHGASVVLGFAGADDAERAINRDLRGGPVLRVAVNGRAAVDVALGATFADAEHVTTGELADALRAGLSLEPVDVHAVPLVQQVVLRADPGGRVVLGGTAAARLGVGPHGAPVVSLGSGTLVTRHLRTHRRNRSSVDLAPDPPAGPALGLTIGDGTNTTGVLTFTAANVGALRSVTVEELHRLIGAHLAAHNAANPPVAVRTELRYFALPGDVSEIRFGPADDQHIWIGCPDGSVFVSRDDGTTWTDVTDARMRVMDRPVEAIVGHPTEAGTIYVGLAGETSVAADPGFLFKTSDGGTSWAPLGNAADGIASDGRPLGVNALELDPADADVVFAATGAGVFRSPDAGATWAPFGEGLPNVPVIDLAAEPTQRRLRAALSPRGAYERRLDDGAPSDVRLVLRAADGDDGERPSRAAPSFHRAAPEPLLADSPDIKHVARRPAVGGDADVDGVAFDLDVPNDGVVGAAAAEVIVQVANLGALVVDPARVVVLWAPVDAGPPPLPGDVWSRLRGGALVGTLGSWTVLGDGPVPRPIGAGDAGIVSFAVNWPALDGVRRVGLLALATHPADAIPDGPLDVTALVATERRAAYRELPVHLQDDHRSLLLRATGGRDFVVADAAAPEGTGVAGRLGFAAGDIGVGGPVRLGAPAAAAGYDLSVGDPAIVLTTAAPIPADLAMLPAAGEVDDIAAVGRGKLAQMINRRAAAQGVPIQAFNPDVGLAIVRRAGSGVTLRVTGGAAAARLGFAVGGAFGNARTSNETDAWFDLTGAAALNLELALPGAANVAVAVNLAADRFPNVAVADPAIIVKIIEEALAGAQLLALVDVFTTAGLAVRARSTGTVALSGPAATGAGSIGFPAPAANVVIAIPPDIDLTAGPNLHVEVTPRVLVRFDGDPADIPDLADARPADVRRAINVACEIASVPVRAEVPRLDLRVAASPGDLARTHAVPGGAHLAELAVLAAGQPLDAAAFTVRAALGVDKLERGVANRLALRVRNTGNVACATTRLRVFDVATAAVPLGVNEIASVTVAVGPGAAHIEELAWDPAGAAPRPVVLLVVADDDRPGRATVVPPFATIEALHSFAAGRSVALRTLEVVDP